MVGVNFLSLPPGSSPDLVLVPATPEERITSMEHNSLAWKGPLDTETYIARENYLHDQDLTRNNVTCWVLVDRNEPKNSRTILASCETYKKKAILAHDGNVEEVATHAIGCVYCRPEFRKMGYAKRMLEELSQQVTTWEMENERRGRSLFTILFSDIGKSFYAHFGWQPYMSSHMSLPPLTSAVEDGDFQENGVARHTTMVRPLSADDVFRYVCNDAILTKLQSEMQLASQMSSGAKVAIKPDFDHFSWHWAREEFFVQNMLPRRGTPVIKGAGNHQLGVYCVWTRSFGKLPQDNVLYILRWVYDKPTSSSEEENLSETIIAILQEAQREAARWGMDSVQLWNPAPILQRAITRLDPSAQVIHRERTSIPCLRWTGSGHGLGNDAEWVLNEKYAWT